MRQARCVPEGRNLRVETKHPTEGWLTRGWIRPTGVEPMTGAGLAGHLTWRLFDYDHCELDPITGDYRQAEQALLEATKEMED